MKRTLGLTLILTGALALAGCGDGGSGSGGSGGNTGGSGTGGSTGGTATGGSTGGTATGGMSTGGMSTGGSTGGGAPAGPQCTTDAAPCALVNDCCSCMATGPGEPAPPCDVPECFVDTCTGEGLAQPQEAHCAAGQCVAGFVCDGTKVACNSLPPDCADGYVASVQGACWGGCVPATECLSVGSCADCTGGLVCVANETMLGYEYHCVLAPPGCAGTPSCACMGGAVCAGTYHLCSETANGLQCACPEC